MIHRMQGLHLTADLRGCSRANLSMTEPGALRTLCLQVVAEAVDGLVLKPMFIGGLQRSLTLAERAAAAGLSVVVTTALDAAIGRAGALHVAAACPQGALWPCGLDTGGLLERDLFVSDRVIGGTISPRGPGLGLVPLATACAAARHAGSPTP